MVAGFEEEMQKLLAADFTDSCMKNGDQKLSRSALSQLKLGHLVLQMSFHKPTPVYIHSKAQAQVCSYTSWICFVQGLSGNFRPVSP